MATLATPAEKKGQQVPEEKGERKPRPRVDEKFKIFCGTANEALADEVCHFLGLTRGQATITRFKDGECYVQIQENVRGADVFVMQPTCRPVDEHLMELLLMIDALKRASARRITAVIPYYGYARQDRKVAPRVPISAKLVADLLTTAGASRLLTMDLHAGQIQGFFDIPVDNLFATPVVLPYVREKVAGGAVTVISPDAGGVERARAFAKKLDAGLAIIDKRRPRANEVAEMRIIGEVQDTTSILVDDIVDTAGTICTAAAALKKAGATRVLACCTHAVLSGPAIDRLGGSEIEELIVTDTIPLRAAAKASGRVHVRPVAHLLAEAIRRTHDEESISSLFDS